MPPTRILGISKSSHPGRRTNFGNTSAPVTSLVPCSVPKGETRNPPRISNFVGSKRGRDCAAVEGRAGAGRSAARAKVDAFRTSARSNPNFDIRRTLLIHANLTQLLLCCQMLPPMSCILCVYLQPVHGAPRDDPRICPSAGKAAVVLAIANQPPARAAPRMGCRQVGDHFARH